MQANIRHEIYFRGGVCTCTSTHVLSISTHLPRVVSCINTNTSFIHKPEVIMHVHVVSKLQGLRVIALFMSLLSAGPI